MFLKLNQAEQQVLFEVSRGLGIQDAQWLYDLINFESGWNPQAKNPLSSARGLIQFVDSTARGLGLEDSADLVSKYPDRISQLRGPVYNYLSAYTPFTTKQSLTMSVFYPAYRSVDPDTVFPDSVLRVNPGINTPADYMNFVYGIRKQIPLILIGAAIAGIAYVFFSLSQRGNEWQNKRRQTKDRLRQ